MNIFVAKLSWDTNEYALEQAFQAFGEVESAKVIYDRVENRSKGFGFVEMPNDEEANNAIEALDGSTLDGRKIVVKEARPREERSGGGRQGGYQRGGNRGGYDRGNRY